MDKDKENNSSVQGVDNVAFEPPSSQDLSAGETVDKQRTKDADGVERPSTKDADGVERPPTKDADGEDDEDNLPCGYGPCEPSCCQPMRNIKLFLFFLCCAACVQGMIVSGFVNVAITTLEKRFELPSTQSGIIVSSYDIASVICLIPVSYLGGIGRKPRWLGFGVFIIGIGSLIYALPHFLTGQYEFQNSQLDNSCQAGTAANESLCDASSAGVDNGLSRYRTMFIIAQLLHGAGSAPLYTIGVTYLDDNLKAKQTSLYAGIYYSMSIVGPAIGYLLGGYLLNYYCDFDSVDVTTLPIGPDSLVWVGAWWLGFLLAMVLAFIIAIPILAFPKYMPGTAAIRASRESETYGGKTVVKEDGNKPKGIMKILLQVKTMLVNPTFIFLNLAGCSEGFLVQGFAAFMPKFIESQFAIASSTAAIYVGAATVPMGGGGTLLGGYLVKKFDLKVRGILRLCIGVTIISLLACLTFLIACPNPPFAGANQPYKNATKSIDGTDDPLLDQCNADCGCDRSLYQPMCGSDGIMYFSPCYAGCEVSIVNNTKVYHDCQCVDVSPHEATGGTCETDCAMLGPFLAIFALAILLTFMATMPALTATIRCVPDESKSFALGIQWIFIRCLGTIPSPIAFGALIDRSCLLWQGTECDASLGACYAYDNKNLALYLLALSLVFKVLTLIFFSIAAFLYKKPASSIMDDVTNEVTGANGGTGNENGGFDGSNNSNVKNTDL